jgi:hypothetical protein
MPDPETTTSSCNAGGGGGGGVQHRLLMWQLPFSDDIRGFTFPSFEKVTTTKLLSFFLSFVSDVLLGIALVAAAARCKPAAAAAAAAAALLPSCYF